MKLLKMIIKNFRSFGQGNEGDRITFKDGINLIVGENNAGKSTILRATELFGEEKSLNENDWHAGPGGKEIVVEMEMELNEKEQLDFIRQLARTKESQIPENINRLVLDFGNRISLILTDKGRWLKAKDLYISHNQAYLTQNQSAQKVVKWTEILDVYYKTPVSSIFGLIKERVSLAKVDCLFDLQTDIENSILNLVKTKLKSFSEVRQRPGGKNQKVLESYDGSQVADVLGSLKMGTRQQRKRFELIQKEFAKLFTNLKIDVVRESPSAPPFIVIEKSSIEYEVPLDLVGAGIGEMVILLTHLIASEGMVFGLDMPELHFHPHAQRSLLEILKRHSQRNQILVITHSPIFFEPEMVDNLMVVRDREGKTAVTQLPEGYLDLEEKAKLGRYLDAYNKEFLFSRAVLIVDGETEIGALPIFSKALGRDFNILGISLVRTGKHFGILVKLLRGLDFPYLVMADKDALVNIEGSIDVGGQRIETSPVFFNLEKAKLLTAKEKETICQVKDQITLIDKRKTYSGVTRKLSSLARTHDVYVLPSDFEGILADGSNGDIFDEAKKSYGSKVTCGSYCAQEIVRQKRKIPRRFAEVIEMIASKSVPQIQ